MAVRYSGHFIAGLGQRFFGCPLCGNPFYEPSKNSSCSATGTPKL